MIWKKMQKMSSLVIGLRQLICETLLYEQPMFVQILILDIWTRLFEAGLR